MYYLCGLFKKKETDHSLMFSGRTHSRLYVGYKRQLSSHLAANRKYIFCRLCRTVMCSKSVQSNTSVAIVWTWIAHNRHITSMNIDIYWYYICQMSKHASSFSKASIFTVHTWRQKRRFQIYPLCIFNKLSFHLQKRHYSVDERPKWREKRCVFKRKHISVEKA